MCAIKQELMYSWQSVPQVEVSHAGARPSAPANEYDAPDESLRVMLRPGGSAHRTK
jgi:hypothetical protein